jgi:hypothetical protein
MREQLITLMLAGLLLSSCAAQPYAYRVVHVAPTTTPEAIYKCALSTATSLGYTIVEQANKDSGTFKVYRSPQKVPSFLEGVPPKDWGERIRFWGTEIHEELTVLVLNVPNQLPTLQVTAAAEEVERPMSTFDRDVRLRNPTTEGKADADNLLATCAK